MCKKQKQLYIGLGIAIFCVIFFVILSATNKEKIAISLPTDKAIETSRIQNSVPSQTTGPKNKQASETPVKITEEKTPSVTVHAGNIIVSLEFTPNANFYDTLVLAKEKGKIEFAGKNYPGLGFFVTDIGTLHANGKNNLIYDINGKEATVGVSSYTLKDGDIIEWKLE